MEDFEQLWNNYQAQIRSENEVSARMQKEFWDIVYPIMLAKATQIALKYRGKNQNITIIEPEELIQDGFLKLFNRIKNNPKPLVFKNLDKFIGNMFKIMKNLNLDHKKEQIEYKRVNDDEIDEINFNSEEYTEDLVKEYFEDDYDAFAEDFSEEYNLIDSLNNIKEYGLKDVFNSFKEINKICYELICLVKINRLSYDIIVRDFNNFKDLTYDAFRQKISRCIKSLRVFKNEHYLKLVP